MDCQCSCHKGAPARHIINCCVTCNCGRHILNADWEEHKKECIFWNNDDLGKVQEVHKVSEAFDKYMKEKREVFEAIRDYFKEDGANTQETRELLNRLQRILGL